ncbi:hypothetical protein J0A71_08g17180 [Encephalitozoon cuniculi]|nr:hypothetical protein J0A71_08g17180 [Encephalitozoon cuniculi]
MRGFIVVCLILLMKIVAEYDIKLSKEDDPVVLYRLPNTETNFRIEAIRHKQQFKYLEMDMGIPRAGRGVQGAKDKRPIAITYASHGTVPSSVQWYGKIYHFKRVVVLRRIECIYLFNPKFKSPETEKSAREIDGYQFRKTETREEKDHRRKNINYHIKRMNLEEFVMLKYKRKEMCQEYGDIPKLPVSESSGRPIMKIRDSIINAKVVNFSELVLLYRDENAVKAALSRYTNFIHGRYVLSNMFYEKSLHSIRDGILELFEGKERVLSKDVYQVVGDEDFLAEELCRRDGKYFYLRGFSEDTKRCDGVDIGQEIASLVAKHQPCTVESIQQEMLLEADAIRRNLPGNVAVLANGMLAVCSGDERRRKIVEMLVMKKSWRKSEVLKIAQNELGGIEDFLNVLCEYCEMKGNVWSIRE